MPALPSYVPPALRVRGQRFLDLQGREVILHGVNLVNKDRACGYIGPEDAATFARMRAWGFNCLRLGVIWDGLEPQPGVFDAAYLERVAQQVRWASEAGLYVFLDMHQDLYSVRFADGAPEWATLTGDQPHLEMGFVWDDAYFTSPAVQRALDNFWQNAPAPDGLGLQEHYAHAWGRVAARFCGEPAVIGYDLMNEPFPGSAAASSQWMIFEKGAELLAQLDGPGAPGAEELAGQWLDPLGRRALLERMRDIPLFSQAIDVTYPIYAAFERGPLRGLYQRAAEAIRAADPGRILFLESSMGSNMGVGSALEPLLAADGQPDPAQAYAPHGYDLVVDTPYLAESSPERVELIFTRHAATAARCGLPMLTGEWGAFPRDVPGTLPAAWSVAEQFERLLCGDTFWHFAPDLEQNPAFRAISRPYPQCIAGRLSAYRCSPDLGTFECAWEEDPACAAPSLFYLPAWLRPQERAIQLEPAGEGFQLHQEGAGFWLSVPPLPAPARRSLFLKSK